MADDKKPVDAGGDSVDAEALKKKLEALEAKLQTVDADLEAERRLRQEATADRDKAKAEKRAIEEAKLTEQGQYKELYEKALKEIEDLKASVDALTPYKSKAETAESQLKARDDAEKAAILESIPEANREEWKDSDIVTLRKVAPLYAKPANGTPPSKAPATGKYTPGSVDFSEMSEKEQFAYARDHNMTPIQIAEARMKAKNKKR